MCYGICTADADGGYIEERYEVSKNEPDDSPEPAERPEPPQPRGAASPLPAPQEPKDVLEKKKDWDPARIDCCIGFHIIKRVYLLNLDI